MVKKLSIDIIEKCIEQISPLDIVAQRLAAVAGNSRTSADEVTKVLVGDQVIAAKILKLANASMFGQGGKISSINRAVVLLGNRAIESLAFSYSAVNSLKGFKTGNTFPRDKFWRHSMAVATVARVVAEKIRYPTPEEAFLVGLLHDMGQLVLCQINPENYAEVLKAGPDSFLSKEKELYDVTHPKICATLLTQWHLPEVIHDAVSSHHDGSPSGKFEVLVGIVMLSQYIAAIHGMDSLDFIGAPRRLPYLAKLINVSPRDWSSIFQESRSKLFEACVFFKIPGYAELHALNKDVTPTSIKLAVLSPQSFTTEWFGALCRLYGYRPLMSQFHSVALFEQFSQEDGCLLDIKGAEPLLIEQLKKISEERKFKVVLLPGDIPEDLKLLLDKLPTLSYVARQSDMDGLFKTK